MYYNLKQFDAILREFSDITTATIPFKVKSYDYDWSFCIPNARRPSPEKLRDGKGEFQHMLDLGV